jgi:hypothetical protein
MSRATPEIRNFAKRLVALEMTCPSTPEVKYSAGLQVCDKLRPHFASLMGNGGFRALLSRAIALSGAEVQWLRALHVKADGALEGVEQLHAEVSANEFAEGSLELLAQLLGLLVALIGENLTLHLMREVWSELSAKDLEFGKGDEK